MVWKELAHYDLYRMHNLWLYAQARSMVGTGDGSLLWLWIIYDRSIWNILECTHRIKSNYSNWYNCISTLGIFYISKMVKICWRYLGLGWVMISKANWRLDDETIYCIQFRGALELWSITLELNLGGVMDLGSSGA